MLMQQMNAKKQSELDTKPTLASFAAIKQRFTRGSVGSTAVSETINTKADAQVDAEEDPLEAYMSGIEKNAAKQESVADLALKQNQSKTAE